MAFEVKIVADSVTTAGKRLTTLTATYPRFILAEVNTHRMLSKNSASSRAIPWHKMKGAIEAEPVVPIKWGMEQSGMQTGDEIPEHMREFAEYLWLQACSSALYYADLLANIGRAFKDRYPSKSLEGDENIRIHKSLANRLVEPWMWTTTLITATEWQNLFALRCHPAAEIHFQTIATMVRDAMAQSTPRLVQAGEWHLPYIDEADEGLSLEDKLKVSVARCARVSYRNHEGTREVDKDLGLHDKLFGPPVHASPFEHQATPGLTPDERSGNLIGWAQYRKKLANENVPG